MQKQWKRLQRDLPSGIYVRAFEDRMDLLRACIVGPEDTPYESALFFFDIQLPGDYPQSPPAVYYYHHGGGNERLNPNLYKEGKVCLSLLGTWQGDGGVESWNPGKSNLMQAGAPLPLLPPCPTVARDLALDAPPRIGASLAPGTRAGAGALLL